MTETILKLAEILSETNNQVALLCFFLMIMLGFVLVVVMRLLSSVFDLKKSMYEANILPDRGKKGERY